jgi:Ca2+-transporting ATPase
MSLGLDPPKPGIMDRAPRDRNARILTGARLARITVTAVLMTVITLGVLLWQGGDAPGAVPDESAAYTVAFTLFVFLQLANAFVVRSGNLSLFSRFTFSNRPLLLAAAAVVLTQVLVVQVPFLQGVFGTVGLTLNEWGICVGGAVLLLALEEVRSLVARAVGGSGAEDGSDAQLAVEHDRVTA